MKTALKVVSGLAVVLTLAACSSKYSSPLSPALPGASGLNCSGVAYGSLAVPSRAIIATSGNLLLSGVNLLVDSYSSANGVYGGTNILSNGDLQAGGNIVLNGVSQTIHGGQSPGLTSSAQVANTQSSCLGNLLLSGTGQTITFAAGDYYYNQILISGTGITLACTGKVRIWFNNLLISGTGATLGDGTPGDLWLLGNCGSALEISGASVNISACLFDPSGRVLVSGTNVKVYGAVVGAVVEVSGLNVNVHRDQALSL